MAIPVGTSSAAPEKVRHFLVGVPYPSGGPAVVTLRAAPTYGLAVWPDSSASLQLASEDNSCPLTLHSPSWGDADMLWLTADCHGTELSASTGV